MAATNEQTLIAALDIGSSKVSALIVTPGEDGRLRVLGSGRGLQIEGGLALGTRERLVVVQVQESALTLGQWHALQPMDIVLEALEAFLMAMPSMWPAPGTPRRHRTRRCRPDSGSRTDRPRTRPSREDSYIGARRRGHAPRP